MIWWLLIPYVFTGVQYGKATMRLMYLNRYGGSVGPFRTEKGEVVFGHYAMAAFSAAVWPISTAAVLAAGIKGGVRYDGGRES